MKENIDQMRERHAEEIIELQNRCEHEDISDWMPSMWAPGHFGNEVRICRFCGMIVENRGFGVGQIGKGD